MSGSSRPAWITLAQILRPQGRRGEVLADLLTDFPETLTSRTGIALLGPASAVDTVPRPVTILRSWLPHGRNEGRIVLEIEGIGSIAEAELLTDHQLVVPATERLPLQDGSAYISDLVGLRLVSGGALQGIVFDVSFPLSPDGRRKLTDAAPLLVVHTEDGVEVLVPFVRDYLAHVDPDAGTIEMQLPEGLFDVQDPASETVAPPSEPGPGSSRPQRRPKTG